MITASAMMMQLSIEHVLQTIEGLLLIVHLLVLGGLAVEDLGHVIVV